MSVEALEPKPCRELRVAIVAANANRHRELVRIVMDQGHAIADEANADVILADAAIPVSAKPLVTLGAEDREQAASLPRDANGPQLDAALRGAVAGLIVRAVESRDGFAAAHDGAGDVLLTPREVEILSAIAAGLGNKSIAHRLDISLHTVKFHVESLFRKLRARTRAEAVAKGLERRRAETIDL
jgi:DNA-binding CsgD family transcriptional regulator